MTLTSRPAPFHACALLAAALAVWSAPGLAQSALAGAAAKPTLAASKTAPLVAAKGAPAAPNAQARSIIIVGGSPQRVAELNPQPLPPKQRAPLKSAPAR